MISTWTDLNTRGHFKCSDLRGVIYSESVVEAGLSARYQQPLNHRLQPLDHTTSPLASMPVFPPYHPGASLGLVCLKYTHGMSKWSHPELPGLVARDTDKWTGRCFATVYSTLDAWCIKIHTNTIVKLQGGKYSGTEFYCS